VRDVALQLSDNPIPAPTDPTGRSRTSARTPPSKPLAYSWYRARRVFFLESFADGCPLSTATNPVYKSHLRLKVHAELLRPFIADAPHGMRYDDRYPHGLAEDIEDKRGPTYITSAKGSGLVHPAPERFALIKAEVDRRLNDSLKRFIDVSFTNTGFVGFSPPNLQDLIYSDFPGIIEAYLAPPWLLSISLQRFSFSSLLVSGNGHTTISF